jgi:transcriptional regulator with XRE-family HTH domain
MQKIDLEIIKTLRKKKGLSQGELANRLGYKTSIGYHYLESGRCQIKADQLVVLANALGVEVRDLFSGSNHAGLTT